MRNTYIRHYCEWMNEMGFPIGLEEVHDFFDRNILRQAEQEKGYVVVINDQCRPSSVRCIIKLEEQYDPEKVSASFYEVNPKLDGDEFVFCSSGIQMLDFIRTVESRRGGHG